MRMGGGLRSRVLVALAAGCGALSWSMAAAADEAPPPPRWHLAADLETDFPLDFAVRVQAEAPFRLRFATSLGWMPRPYVGAINAVLVGAGAYDDDTANLIATALQNSIVWRTQVGYRPFAARGFYFEAGYGLVALGGGGSAAELIAAAIGRTAPEAAGRVQFDISSAVHMADVEIGWEWTVWSRLHLRAALGGAFTFAAASSISASSATSTGRGGGAALSAFEQAGAAYLDDLYRSYVFSPTLTVGAGYAFF